MDTIPINIIESDTLTRDALILYLAKSLRFRILYAGSYKKYTNDSYNTAKISLVGESPGTDIVHVADMLISKGVSKLIILCQNIELEKVLSLLEREEIVGILYKNEINRDVGSAIERAYRGYTILTKSVAETILSHRESPQIDRPQIVQSSISMDLQKETDYTLYLFAILGLSKEEIAQELCISLNTVSSRVRAAYLKLGVSNRHDAFEALTESKLENLEF